MGPCEKAASEYEERKRMKKLEGIQEEKGIDSGFEEKVGQLADNIIELTNELKRRKSK